MSKVLIIDDVQPIRVQLSRLVSTLLDCEIRTAENGAVAINMLNDYQPDLVFLDIVMPVMDGIQALSMIRTRCPDVKIVMISSLSTTDKIEWCTSNGADAYLTKPFNQLVISEFLETEFQDSVNLA